jgi:hypothetical protein
MWKSSLPIAAALTAAATLAGCLFPSGVGLPDEPTVGSVLANNAAGRLVNLRSGADGVSVPLTANRSAFFLINTQSRTAGTVQVAITANEPAAAYRTAALGPDAAAPTGTGATSFEPKLRAWEASLKGVKPGAKRYKTLQAPGYALGATERFWVISEMAGADLDEVQVTAKAAYVGEHCYVFVDEKAGASAEALAARAQVMGKTFDEQIFPTNSRLFGAPVASGVNGDARITLLVSPAVGNYGRDTTIGYFTVRDLFKPEDDPSQAILKRSNRRLMLYMSSYVVSRGQAADYLGTVAHEFEHLINASQRLFATGAKATEDVWLDEGLAMYAMEANGYGLGGAGGVVYSHVAAYQAQPERFSLTNWQLNPDESAYGAAYLYTTYLVDRFGEEILKKLVTSPSVGIANVQGVLGTYDATFEDVFEDWTAANMFDHTGVTTDPRFNYKRINMLGTYGNRRLRGMTLAAVKVPNVGTLELKPYSARYYYVPRPAAGDFRFSLTAEDAQRFGGWLVAP